MNKTSRAALIFGALAVGAVSAMRADAQRPFGADTLSPTAVAESLVVMRQLERAVRTAPDSAALWYRIGMIAWALHDRDRAGPPVAGIDWTLLGRKADTSLRLAKHLEPRNPRYALTAGQFFLGTGLVTMREQSYGMFGEALEIARATNNPLVHAEAAIEVGRVYWRRYDAVANGGAAPADAADVRLLARLLATDTLSKSATGDPERATKTRPYTRRTVARARQNLDRRAKVAAVDFAGESDYMMAEQYLREAYETLPTLSRAYLQLAMLLADRVRWTELADLATDQIEVAPGQAWAWMTLGLATQRLGDAGSARVAFDSAVRRLSATERERVDRLERVITHSDSAARTALSPADRAAGAHKYWLDADPLWSRDDLDPHTEFLSRVTFAELRWTVEELMKRGADSDRGNIHVRYGPPDRVATHGDGANWAYDYAGLAFRFHEAAAYGTASFSDFGRAAATIDSIPVRWDNLPIMRIDSIPMQVARFRATATAMDVFFAGRASTKEIARATDVAGPVRTDFWMLDAASKPVRRDSAPRATADVQTFTQRVPYGAYTYRLEATAAASTVAGRSAGVLAGDTSQASGLRPTGFAMSDVVLATRAAARGTSARRWTEFDVVPLMGSLSRGADLALLWENYDFGARDANATYSVTVTIRRERSRAGRIAAQIIGNLAGVVGRNATSDRVEMTVERSAPHAAEFTDHVTIGLGSTPAGSYLVTVAVTDHVGGATTSRTNRLVIAD